MKKKSFLPAVFALAVIATGCGSDGTNPFEAFSRLELIPPEAELVLVSNLHAGPGAFREAFALTLADGSVTRLTHCSDGEALCDNLEAAPNADRLRVALRRVPEDINRDGILDAIDGVALIVAQLDLGFESPFTPVTAAVDGIDWVPNVDRILYGGFEPLSLGQDIFAIESNGQGNQNLTGGAGAPVRHRRPRAGPAGQVAVYERTLLSVDEEGEVVNRDEAATSAIWIFQSSAIQFEVTRGGPSTGEQLPGTRFLVGSDTDPVFDPDRTRIAFRRLTEVGGQGIGNWDVLSVDLDGSNLEVVASGPQHRSSMDWGPQGIVFVETDFEAGTRQVVIVQPDGSGRQTPLTVSPEIELDHPRWLAPAAVPQTTRRAN